MKIKRLFIANRGEICRRIATTARQMGVETVAITDKKRPPLYLNEVIDHFVKVETENTSLYLDGAKVIQLAKDAGADAIHPGFGFLSENAGFARSVEAAGLIWVGPRPEAIDLMASKALARNAAIKANVPCIQGLQDFAVPDSVDGDFSELMSFAKKAGYPLLVKAAFGGGGKGMRTVYSDTDLPEAVVRAHSEAKSSFGDGALICEQFLETPRHVEVQVLADKHGNAYAIGDRDCSLQRRHQKVIEEAPAPQLNDETRKAMHAAAIELSKAVGYDSTGTVEFLLDWSEDARKQDKQKFYFLEMNTRLQVEHPVTEEVFGLDLVSWQLRVASGEKLPDFSSLTPRGHSLEARLYAEDVNQNFFPAPGPVACFHRAEGPGIRWEVGLDEVDEITGNFDPMIAKLITTAASREEAVAKMVYALENSFFAGPEANLSFLMHICRSTEFREAPVPTSYLKNRIDDLVPAINAAKDAANDHVDELLTLLETGALFKQASHVTSPDSLTKRAFAASAQGQENSAAWQILSQKLTACGRAEAQTGAVNGPQRFRYAYTTTENERVFWVGRGGFTWRRSIASGSSAGSAGGGNQTEEMVATVPGKVTACKIAAGSEVKAGDSIFILESMKMEFEVKAPKDGTIESLNVAEGDQVKAGQKLAEWQ